MAKFHLNPKTGNPNQCRAKDGNCPFGFPAEHFGTKDAAREAFEAMQQGSFTDAIPPRSQWVGGHYDGERDIVDGRPGRWSTSLVTGWGRNERATFFADDAGLQDDVKNLPASFDSDDWRSVERSASSTGHLVGLEAAQQDYLAYENNEGAYAKDWGQLFDGDVVLYSDELVKRALNGEKSKYDYELYQRNFKQIDAKEKIFFALTHEETGIMSQNVLDAALAFPERDLFPVLQRLGVGQVSVSALKNTRETGLVYTVLTPEGHSRSFSLYEHRNHDSLCISGATDWNVEEQPYGPYAKNAEGRDSKENVFAEFSHDTSKRQIAETLGYLLQSAQNGTLESDQDLIAKAERLDWTAIISKQIPAFGEWVREKEADKRAIADPTGSFAQWEKEMGL